MKLSGKQLYGAAVFALVLPTGWAFYRWVSSLLSSDVPSAFHGTRLGMSVAEVRSRFDARGAGDFHARPDVASGWSIEWTATSASAVRSATFEFHEGLLVAVRAVVDRSDALTRETGLTVTSGTVRRVTSRPDAAFDVLLLSRACPAHAAEVRSLLRSP